MKLLEGLRPVVFQYNQKLTRSLNIAKSSTFWLCALLFSFFSIATYELSFLLSKPTLETVTTDASYTNTNSDTTNTTVDSVQPKLKPRKSKKRKESKEPKENSRK
jgi:hypothetical protein